MLGVSVMTLFMTGFFTDTIASPLSTSSNPSSCASSEYKEFDFWVGDWDVFESDGTTPAAHVRVERILNDCVLWERYEDPSGLRGESFSTYDVGRKRWHQTWVTNRGQLLTMEGQLQGAEMVLVGGSHTSDGQEARVRGTWKAVSDGVRETAIISSDAGKTWKPWFGLRFRSRPRSAKEDQETVAALDQQFQAAVKANDFDTMDKILADDFVLVTGSGKVFKKSDLLQEARSQSSTYEHQEDTERTVRVWDDTAVVTAKLWIKGVRDGKPIDYTLWFSDTYVRTPDGWRYVFGQASLPLPKTS
jgi:ketosteroid isomerase-like protein